MITSGHRARFSREWICWHNMKQRCQNPNRKDYAQYGAKGITVCQRWQQFANFLRDMGLKPPGLTIQRVDGSKGYSPDNCKWATWDEQYRNRR